MATVSALPDLVEYRKIWEGEASSIEREYPGWLEAGFALLGDFSGIQGYVLKPVPGARGAAKRLRSRSFRVSAYTELVARYCLSCLPAQCRAGLLYSAGGRFLICAAEFDGWAQVCQRMHAAIDEWAWEEAEGEFAFHLAAVPFSRGSIPSGELARALEARRNQPLGAVLRDAGGWQEGRFFARSQPGQGRCLGCAATRVLADHGEMCERCLADLSLGQSLLRSRYGRICAGANGEISALGVSLELRESKGADAGEWLSFDVQEPGTLRWPVIRQAPVSSAGETLDFDEIAEFSPGSRKFLGYARIDADHVGERFGRLEGDPRRVWGLSRLLHTFFGSFAGELLRERFPRIYAVYGGGDDVFVIGPWAAVLDYICELRGALRNLAGERLTFSAGVHLARPLEHVLAAAEEAAHDLEKAKVERAWGRETGRDQVRAFGALADWETFGRLLEEGKKAAKWLEEGALPSAFLRHVIDLHLIWRRSSRPADKVRFRPLLYYQSARTIGRSEVRDWANSIFREDGLWPWADFLARYAFLASRRAAESEDSNG